MKIIGAFATLAATFVAALFVDTIGAIDPFGGKVYLPSPRQYLATFLLWGMLGMIAAFGERPARLAARISVLTLLTGAVLGPFGKKAITFFESSARFAAAAQGNPA